MLFKRVSKKYLPIDILKSNSSIIIARMIHTFHRSKRFEAREYLETFISFYLDAFVFILLAERHRCFEEIVST